MVQLHLCQFPKRLSNTDRIIAILLEVYDNLIGDQFITPIIQLIPLGHAFALNDLPYMFLFVTGIALVRKPGAATAMVFLNFILMLEQLLEITDLQAECIASPKSSSAVFTLSLSLRLRQGLKHVHRL